jgi:phosphoglycerate dehydrogenase-like enzyme
LLKGIYILDNFRLIYDGVHEEIGKYVDIYTEPQTKESIKRNPSVLNEADVIFSGWGCPVMDDLFLKNASNLKAVFYGAGTIKGFVTDEFWDRKIMITSAYAANAVPVVEFTLSQILYSLKRGWHYAFATKDDQKYPVKEEVPGGYRSTVGIISLGMIGRKVCELLKNFDVRVIAYDPFATQEDADQLNVELSSLKDLFRQCDVVSLHTPWIKETEGLITGDLFTEMKRNATFINTARGAIVRENEMIDVLRQRPDLYAVLDVTYPEPPIEGSPLYTLPNVVLTPHIAGSMSKECQRMGEYMLQELKRYIEGQPLKWSISQEKAAIMA